MVPPGSSYCNCEFGSGLRILAQFGSGSGSRKLLNSDPIRIRIHNTAKYIFCQLSLSNLTYSASFLAYICGSGSVFGIQIWIQKAPEYGSYMYTIQYNIDRAAWPASGRTASLESLPPRVKSRWPSPEPLSLILRIHSGTGFRTCRQTGT